MRDGLGIPPDCAFPSRKGLAREMRSRDQPSPALLARPAIFRARWTDGAGKSFLPVPRVLPLFLPLHQHQADSIPLPLAGMRRRLIAQRHNADQIRFQMKVGLQILADH